MISAGKNLRAIRERLGLTLRDVENASQQLARKNTNDKYLIPVSRLSDFETRGVIPGIYRLYSLAIIYKLDFRELLSWYGIDLNKIGTHAEARG
jgi:transcriptional regulator with XRE-family HTH domain